MWLKCPKTTTFISCSKAHVTKAADHVLRGSSLHVMNKNAKGNTHAKAVKAADELSGAIKSRASNRSISCTIRSTSPNN